MDITTTEAPHITPCYGIFCNDREGCARYQAVARPNPGATKPIGTCVKDGERPLFIAVEVRDE